MHNGDQNVIDLSPCPQAHPVPIHPADPHEAHHITEFGEVENLVHLSGPHPHEDEALPAPPISRKDKLASRERVRRLRQKFFAPRHLMQYFRNNTLYRTPENRSIGPDELFLDLVIVGGIAALGHELRESFDGWKDVEKFCLLFGAIYSSWRSIVFFWNVWGVSSDLLDKAGIYVVFTSLIAIALGAHGAFKDGLRPYVAIASFMASFIPQVSMLILSIREPLLHNNILYNQMSINALIAILQVSPYFAAAFVSSSTTTRMLYWFPLAFQFFSTYITFVIARTILVKEYNITTALAIELIVEKYEVLTMILLGESVIGILFEGAKVVTADDIRLGSLFGAAAASTAMLYSLQTLYANIDGPIAKGGKHAVRHRSLNGITWATLHLPYHLALILFATGIGIAFRDVGFSIDSNTSSSAASLLVRKDETESVVLGSVQKFAREERWLFSVGWGASIILSGLIGATHLAGPRAATKQGRFFIRCLLVIGIMVSMPFTSTTALEYIGVHCAVLVGIAIVEYSFVHMDRLGIFRSEFSLFSSSNESKEIDEEQEDGTDEDYEDSEGGKGKGKVPTSPDGVVLPEEKGEGVAGVEVNDEITMALKMRLCKNHSCRLVAITDKAMKKKKQTIELAKGA